MRTIRWMACLAAAGAAACTPLPPSPVPVSAPGGTAELAGEWAGEYESPALGRAGSILFRLQAGRDTAEGDVLMVPRGAALPARQPAVGSAAQPPTPQVLTIRFVRLEGGRVTGALDPYRDPDCGCTVVSVFEGTLTGDHLAGTFVTRGVPSGPVAGTWHATRRTP